MEGGPNKTKQTLYTIGHRVCGCVLRKIVCLLYTCRPEKKKSWEDEGGWVERERERERRASKYVDDVSGSTTRRPPELSL